MYASLEKISTPNTYVLLFIALNQNQIGLYFQFPMQTKFYIMHADIFLNVNTQHAKI